VSRGRALASASSGGQEAGGASGNPPDEDAPPAQGDNADRHAEAATAVRRKRRAPPRPVVAGSVGVGGDGPTATVASVAIAPPGSSRASSPVAGAEMPVCDYLYPPVCRRCRGVLGRYVNLPRLVCGACDTVGPITPQPADYLGCTRCRFFVCAHCIADLAEGRALGHRSADESSVHATAVAAGVSFVAAEEVAGNNLGATAAADMGVPETTHAAAVSGDSLTEATDRPGRATSSSGSSEDSDICDSYARWHDAAGLVQMPRTVHIRQHGASVEVALTGNLYPTLGSVKQADGLSARSAPASHRQGAQVGCLHPDATSYGQWHGVGGHAHKASISQGQGVNRTLADGGKFYGRQAEGTRGDAATACGSPSHPHGEEEEESSVSDV